jgi:type IV pilus assembly protein PilQ
LLVLNKQRAEILIGSQIPYTTSTVTQTFTTQTVQFLDIGTQLRLRPYVSSDGSIRMEVHPEVSSEGPIFDGIPSKNLTEVTTNIMCYDGCTVVIGGLMQEDLQSNFTQIPFLGSLPVVGPLFRQKNDTNVRREILVLVTPRIIYEPEYDNESIAGQNEFVERETVAADSQILLGRSVSARRFIRSAMAARDAGNFTAARRYANLAVRFDPNNRSAIDLRDELNAMQPEMHSVIDRPPQQVLPGGTVPTTPRVPNLVVPGEPLPGDPEILPPEPGAPESIEAVEPPPMGMRFVPVPSHPVRPGVPGRNAEIFKPGAFNNEPYPADQN